jgi:hypothetical protein
MTQSLRLAALTCILAIFATAQPPQRPAAWLDPVKDEPAGTHYKTFTSRLAGGEVSYLISLPARYEIDQAARYPVVYWLHGLGGDQRSGAKFVEELNAAERAGKAPAMIVVLVNGMRDAFYNDSPDANGPSKASSSRS